MSLPHLALVLLITFLWGMNFLAVKLAVTDFPPILANMLRFSVVFLILFPALKRIRGQMTLMLWIAGLMGVLHFGAVFLAMGVATDLAPIAIVAQTNVPFATLLAIVVLGERIGAYRIAGIALSFAGVLVLGLEPGALDQVTAVILVLFAALIYAVCAILMRKIRFTGPMTLQAWIALAAVPGSLALSLLFETGQAAALADSSWRGWGGIVYSAIAASIVGHGGMYYLFQRYEVGTVAPFMLLAPVFAVLGAVIFLGETLDWRDWVGGALTLMGVLVITLRDRERKGPETPAPDARTEAAP